jgi:hypothetical protein
MMYMLLLLLLLLLLLVLVLQLWMILTHAGYDLWAAHTKVMAHICRADCDDIPKQTCQGRAAVDL